MKHKHQWPVFGPLRSLLQAILLMGIALPVKAQEYRMSAGIGAGSFYAADLKPFTDKGRIIRQTDIHIEYHFLKRWTAGVAAGLWSDPNAIPHGMPMNYYDVSTNTVLPHEIQARSKYSYYDLSVKYDVIHSKKHVVYGGAGISYIEGLNAAWDGVSYWTFDMGTGHEKAIELERFHQFGACLKSGYRYHIGASGRWSAGADLTARFARQMPLQLYYGFSMNLNIGRVK